MKTTNRLFKIYFLALYILAAGSITASAQTTTFRPKDPELFKTIAHMDSMMFNAFNNKKLDVIMSLFADNVEFYNDGKGVTGYEATRAGFRGIFEGKQTADLRRDLLPQSLEVYPMPGFGAIEMGTHRFTHTENGKPVIGIMKFVHIWQLKDGQWKVTRVASVGH